MKKCLTLLAATVLTGMTFASFAAQPYTSPATGQLQASGTVSATGASNLSDLEDKLAEKAKEQGQKALLLILQAVKTRCTVPQLSISSPPPSPNCIRPNAVFCALFTSFSAQFVINVLAF
ncbi:Multiple stress resistance protein BhsA precursor [Citrobacter freundii]|nr:Multiple stress resistance protein BhsA precursor [Citrobacter freundii]